VNGLSLSKLRAFGATFFIFSDYARPAIRLSALMELPTVFVFTHDAMGDGEDGPTHQPSEQLASLRAIPGLTLIRPGDANEVVEAYRYIMQLKHRPAVLVLSRQPLPTLDRGRNPQSAGVAFGAYVTALWALGLLEQLTDVADPTKDKEGHTLALSRENVKARKSAVLDSLRSPESKRGYRHAIDEFIQWYCSEPRLAFNRTVVLRYRIHLEQRKYAPATINPRLAAVGQIADDAADAGLLSPELAAGSRR
jgi:hypothetical protein